MELLCYTRKPKEDSIYAPKLAYSMHLAYKEGSAFTAFHHNEGLLYAKATQNADGTLNSKSLKNPWISLKGSDGSYIVTAIRTEADGSDDNESTGSILLWETKDFVHYTELGLVLLQDGIVIREARCYSSTGNTCIILWKNATGEWNEGICDLTGLKLTSFKKISTPDAISINPEDISQIEGIVPGNFITIPDGDGEYLKNKLNAPTCVGFDMPTDVRISNVNDLQSIKISARYSDGTSVSRKVIWDTDSIDFNKKGPASVTGTFYQETFNFPIALNRADPCSIYLNGIYYFIATNDADGNRSLYIRKSDTLAGLVNAVEVLLLDTEMHEGIKGLLWAPEFHVIGGSLYIFHAATDGEFFCEESRVMKLKAGGDPMRAGDWSKPELVVKKDLTPLCEAGKVISLDMTTFEYMGKQYAIWSQRQFLPVDQGAWLYIAEIDPDTPWQLKSDPVLLTVPEYGWENNHTFVVEGPYPLWNEKKLLITYSGAAVDSTYAVSLLSIEIGKDILNPSNWEKGNYPLLSSRSAEGEFGPGHNSYLCDENGLTWNFYHARPGVKGPRSSGIRRVHFDIDGEPMLDVTRELDLPEEFSKVKINVTIL